MVSNSKKSGFLATIKAAEANVNNTNTSTNTNTNTSVNAGVNSNIIITTSMGNLFKEGVTVTDDILKKMLERYDDNGDDLSKPQTKFPINLKVFL